MPVVAFVEAKLGDFGAIDYYSIGPGVVISKIK
jgi:hypothetical protein